MSQSPGIQIPALRNANNAAAISVIIAVSAAIFSFLIWLLYFKPRSAYTSQIISALPAVNASLNGISTIFLISGFIAVMNRRYELHMKMMLSALASSAVFFVCYVVYHSAHGDTHFTHGGFIRPVYFAILISHIVLSALVVPLILTSFYLAFAGRYALHRRVSRFTFPIWLYVSITGVVIFAMLKTLSAQ